MTKVVVGLSGGVDSSVSAYLLKQQGYDVTGIFMQNWEDDNNDEYCSIKEDSKDAITIAEQIGIDIDIVNFATEYKDRVFKYFLTEYQNGRTPNPDILCNSEIKFKAFLDHALKLGADYIATGHYVGKTTTHTGETLIRAADSNKDQSYFLYRLNQEQIKHAIFPLANYTKPQVRELATNISLATANKKDSTGICFIGERPFREFLKKYLPTNPGKMVTPDGKIVGEHIGLMYYTIGQRKGIGIGGQGDPWFVADKDLANNNLIVVQGHDNPHLLHQELIATDLSFGLPELPQINKLYTAQVRYRMQDAPCNISFDNDINSRQPIMKVKFTTPQWGVTPGQSIVLYDHNVCLGGGIIHTRYN